MMAALKLVRCPACRKDKLRKQYLCLDCWFKLPPVSRERLGLRDHRAAWRLKLLLKEIKKGTPLRSIEIPY